MKKIMFSIVALFFAGALSLSVKGQNIHAIVPQTQVDRDYAITSAAYMNYHDLYTGRGNFISIEVENKNSLTLRKLDNCLKSYEERYRRNYDMFNSVHDVLQVSKAYSDEYYGNAACIAFCGQYGGYGTVFIADSRLNMVMVRSYEDFNELYSMVELPRYGYVVCGKSHSGKGMYMYIDYLLNPIASYETAAELKHVIHDAQFDRLLFAGKYENELWVYAVKIAPFPAPSPTILGSVACKYPSAQWFDGVKVLPWYDNEDLVMLFSSAKLDPRVNHGHVNNGLIAFVGLQQPSPGSGTHFFFAPQSNVYELGIVRDVSWHKRKIFHMLMDYRHAESGMEGSMLVEPDLEHLIWAGARIRNADSEGLLRMHQIDPRRDCSQMSVGGYEDYRGGYSSSGMPRHSRYADMRMPLQTAGIGSGCEASVEFDWVYAELDCYVPPGFAWVDMRDFAPRLPDFEYNADLTNLICEGICASECIRSAAQENNGAHYGMIEGESMQVSESIVVKAEAITLTSSDYMQYWILDASGRELSHGAATRNDIPLNTLKTGVYILRLQKADGSFEHHKFVKP